MKRGSVCGPAPETHAPPPCPSQSPPNVQAALLHDSTGLCRPFSPHLPTNHPTKRPTNQPTSCRRATAWLPSWAAGPWRSRWPRPAPRCWWWRSCPALRRVGAEKRCCLARVAGRKHVCAGAGAAPRHHSMPAAPPHQCTLWPPPIMQNQVLQTPFLYPHPDIHARAGLLSSGPLEWKPVEGITPELPAPVQQALSKLECRCVGPGHGGQCGHSVWVGADVAFMTAQTWGAWGT